MKAYLKKIKQAYNEMVTCIADSADVDSKKLGITTIIFETIALIGVLTVLYKVFKKFLIFLQKII